MVVASHAKLSATRETFVDTPTLNGPFPMFESHTSLILVKEIGKLSRMGKWMVILRPK